VRRSPKQPLIGLSRAAPLITPRQPNEDAISLETHPFYCDTGATVHISLDNDFFNLRPVSSRIVKGVGGSSIRAIGIGDIKLPVPRVHLLLKDDLCISVSTIRLISVSAITRDSKVRIAFGDDEDDCWITNTSTGALIAAEYSKPPQLQN